MKVVREIKVDNLIFKLVQGDITRYPADVIVNAANKNLEHFGGVALAIAKACVGDAEEYTRISKDAMREQVGKDQIEHGEVVVTPSFKLEEIGIKHVIHTVGPVCGGEWSDELREKLFKALMAPLKKAEDLKVNSIAFPAVSAGIYGCPLENVVKTLLDAVEMFSKESEYVKEVSLVLFSDEDVERALKVFPE